MRRYVKALSLTALFTLSTPAIANDWQLNVAADDGRVTLIIPAGPAGKAMTYRFECTATEVIATQTGVTKLMDLRTGRTISDGADAVMSPGAAMMALFIGKGEPEFKPANAVKNPSGGWDVTIRLPKNDKQLKAIGKSDILSLFTTGYTTAVKMDGAAQAQWSDFMQRCNAVA